MRPVTACPPSTRYRFAKFARRYRLALATASHFSAVLVAATVVSLRQAARADRARADAIRAYAAEAVQRRAAQDQRDRALKAEGDAKANLARARAAVDDYLTTVSENRLLNSPLPGLQPLRRELLITALRYYEDFVSRHQDDLALRADLAAARFRVGEITDQIGSKGEALEAFQAALSAYESLAEATPSPSSGPYRAGQGRCLVRMAVIRDSQGRSDETPGMFERALTLLERLGREQPGDEAIRAELAYTHHHLSVKLVRHANSGAACGTRAPPSIFARASSRSSRSSGRIVSTWHRA